MFQRMSTATSADDLLTLHREEWEPIYHACSLEAVGITLEDFLAAPWQHLVEQGQETAFLARAEGYRPLLPRQAAVARRIRNLDMIHARFGASHLH